MRPYGTRSRCYFKSEGMPVSAYDRAARFLEDWRPDMAGCVVLDIRMPEMDGMELQEALVERGSDLPIIFVTGHGDVPLAVEAMRQGAVDFIEKPYREDQLLEKSVLHFPRMLSNARFAKRSR